MTRAGKSAFMCDLLSQTDPYYDFTLIVEEGLSYGIWTQAQAVGRHSPDATPADVRQRLVCSACGVGGVARVWI